MQQTLGKMDIIRFLVLKIFLRKHLLLPTAKAFTLIQAWVTWVKPKQLHSFSAGPAAFTQLSPASSPGPGLTPNHHSQLSHANGSPLLTGSSSKDSKIWPHLFISFFSLFIYSLNKHLLRDIHVSGTTVETERQIKLLTLFSRNS